MSDETTDIRQTLLYRNTRAVEQNMMQQDQHISDLRTENTHLRTTVTMLQSEVDSLTQRVNIMFAQQMGPGGANGNNH